MRAFKNSPFDFKYETSFIQIQIHDCSLLVYDGFNEFDNVFDYCVDSTDVGYEFNFTINKGKDIKIHTIQLTESFLNKPENHLAVLVDNMIDKNVINTMCVKKYTVVQINKLKITCAIVPELNKFIIFQLGRNASSDDVLKLLRRYNRNMNTLKSSIHKKTLDLIDLVKQKEDSELVKAKFFLFENVKPKYDKCMVEIKNIKKNKKIYFDKELANIQNDPALLRRFVLIWSIDNIAEFQKKCGCLEDDNLKLATYLYKLDKGTRTQKLLENNIYR